MTERLSYKYRGAGGTKILDLLRRYRCCYVLNNADWCFDSTGGTLVLSAALCFGHRTWH